MASLVELEIQYQRLLGQRETLASKYYAGDESVLPQIEAVNQQIRIVLEQMDLIRSPASSSGTIIRDDQLATGQNANDVNPAGEALTIKNGRIQTPPQTNTSSNALISPPAIVNDFGTDAELRPYIQTQSTPANAPIGVTSIAGSPRLFGTDTNSILNIPGGFPGVGAPSDDQAGALGGNLGTGTDLGTGTADVVSGINAINFGDKIVAQPNILDQYASYTYTASLYLITKDNAQRLLNTGSHDLSSAKLLIQSGGIQQNSRTEFFNFDYYIDDIELSSTITGQGSRAAHNVTEVKMKVIEPNGISFIENLDAAVQQFMGGTETKKKSFTSQVYLLVIRFYGYDDQGNLVRGGKRATTSDPNSFVEKFYPLNIEKVGFRIANKCVEYDLKFKAPQYQLNASQGRGSMPFNFEFSGGTVKDILAGPLVYGVNQAATDANAARSQFAQTDPRRVDLTSSTTPPANASAIIPNKNTVRQGLMSALNEFQQEQVKSGKIQYPDEYNIEFALPAMEQASIVLPGVNKSTTSMSTAGTAADKKLGSKQSMDTTSQTVAATAGMQIVQFIDMVLRNSSYIGDQQVLVVDNKTGKETPGPGVNLKNTAWYKISFKAVPMYDKYDEKRNDYAYKITYVVSPYKLSQLYSPYFKQPEFNGVHKTYKYWFTGENVSVLNYEETLNNLYFIVLSNQNQGSTSNVNELLKQQPFTASGQASQGGQGRATEPGANAADQLYSANDLKECDMTIIGDPAWLQQGESYALMDTKDANFYQPFLPDGTINFDSQQVLFEIAFNTPRDYNLGTGLMQPGLEKNTELYPTNTENTGSKAKISRIYIAKKCVSTFRQGKFTQRLNGSLRIYKTTPTTTDTTPATTDVIQTGTPDLVTTPTAIGAGTGTPPYVPPRSSVTDPAPTSSIAKGVQQILSPATQLDSPTLSQLQASPVYIQARRNGATPAAALDAARASFAAGTNNYSGSAVPGIRYPGQQIVKDQ
jgi:hypothetical protein